MFLLPKNKYGNVLNPQPTVEVGGVVLYSACATIPFLRSLGRCFEFVRNTVGVRFVQYGFSHKARRWRSSPQASARAILATRGSIAGAQEVLKKLVD
jgi:hypothetical protein